MLGMVRQRIARQGITASGMQIQALLCASRSYSSGAKEMTVRDALNSALDEEMSADPKVFLMGEEVCRSFDSRHVFVFRGLFIHMGV
ncbi:hypothetical protein RHMOL_Rhmol12G0211200 [Rhododendron molle]|uniref:Uncharacterized protein n=2 Tax=Rhododendron molle TaxID=49168 RepID=A0ACC0LKI9_RHOML|nr:hypothetical protein RHMOL_Rhmol12G0211200 [Rhododendron molle]KAI8529257.1 hypothetical protein RHMOL_Rhmol12G0211200 [Rhododendron molle]